MPPLHLIVTPDPLALLREAADAAGGYRMEGVVLAVRQGGIRDDLLRMAAAAGCPGWFDPPIVTFAELPERLGTTARAPLTAPERQVVLQRVIREHGGSVFSALPHPADFIEPLDAVIGELLTNATPPDALAAAVAAAQLAERWDRERLEAITRIYQAYRDILETSTPPRRDGRDTLVDVAQAMAANPAALRERLGGRTELRVVGLTDLRGGWRTLLNVLRASPAFSAITIHALDDHLVTGEGLVPDTVTTAATPRAVPAMAVLHAPDTDRELEAVAVRVRQLVEAGVAPEDIAIVSRKARPHADLALTALRRVGVPATARQRVALREVPVVKGVLALLTAAADGWIRHGLVELARQPYLTAGLDVRVLDHLGFRERISGLGAWQDAHTRLAATITGGGTAADDEDERGHWIPGADRATAAASAFAEFARQVEPLDSPRTLRAWLEWLEGFLSTDPLAIRRCLDDVPADAWEVARLDLMGWRHLRAGLGRWRRAVATWDGEGTALPIAALLPRLLEVLAEDVPLWTVERRGVQVLEALAADYRPFTHRFLVGMEAGSFPGPRPVSPILHAEDRGALAAAGVPLEQQQDWERRERTLFEALCMGGTACVLSHGMVDAKGREVLGSVFLEDILASDGVTEETIPTSQVLTAGMPIVADDRALAHAAHAAMIEGLRTTTEPHPWNGLVEDPALQAWIAERYGEGYHWSPTQLESYAKCPWSWFSKRMLRLDKSTEPDPDIDVTVRGTIWHAALESFWPRALEHMRAEGRTGEELMLLPDDLPWAKKLVDQSVNEAWEAQRAVAWLGHPALQAVTQESMRVTLSRYLHWEAERNDDARHDPKSKVHRFLRTAVLQHELWLEDIILERKGLRFRYRGSIDRIEVGVDQRVTAPDQYLAAVDYKSTKGSFPAGGHPSAWTDGVVLQVPLYAHALTQQFPGKQVARIEYRAIRHRVVGHDLALVQVRGRKGAHPVLADDPAAVEKMEKALDAAVDHVARVRAGEYPARYVDSCKCPPFCHARDICRVPGGPASVW